MLKSQKKSNYIVIDCVFINLITNTVHNYQKEQKLL